MDIVFCDIYMCNYLFFCLSKEIKLETHEDFY